jgi:hypothetical protein
MDGSALVTGGAKAAGRGCEVNGKSEKRRLGEDEKREDGA